MLYTACCRNTVVGGRKGSQEALGCWQLNWGKTSGKGGSVGVGRAFGKSLRCVKASCV